jgi:hypothetical protein
MPGMLLGFLYTFFAGVQSEGWMCLIVLLFPTALQIIIFSLSEFGYLSDWEWSWEGVALAIFFTTLLLIPVILTQAYWFLGKGPITKFLFEWRFPAVPVAFGVAYVVASMICRFSGKQEFKSGNSV